MTECTFELADGSERPKIHLPKGREFGIILVSELFKLEFRTEAASHLLTIVAPEVIELADELLQTFVAGHGPSRKIDLIISGSLVTAGWCGDDLAIRIFDERSRSAVRLNLREADIVQFGQRAIEAYSKAVDTLTFDGVHHPSVSGRLSDLSSRLGKLERPERA